VLIYALYVLIELVVMIWQSLRDKLSRSEVDIAHGHNQKGDPGAENVGNLQSNDDDP